MRATAKTTMAINRPTSHGGILRLCFPTVATVGPDQPSTELPKQEIDHTAKSGVKSSN
jgi:hypothetical protein